MRSGEAPIGERSSLEAMLERRMSSRRRVRKGLVYVLTALFWGVWSYLVMPVVSLVLWFLGVQLFTRQMVELGGYESLRDSLVAYSLIFLSIVLALVLWIVWNVVRYGGRKDRRTVKAREVTDVEIATVQQIDLSLLEELRSERSLRADLDPTGSLVVTGRGAHAEPIRRALEDPPSEGRGTTGG